MLNVDWKNCWWLAIVAAGLAGCVTTPLTSEPGAQAPISQQESGDDARKRAKAHTELGTLYLGNSKLDTALSEARIALEADASYPLAYNLLGLVQMYLKENAAAEEAFRRALALAPTDAEINNNYGWFVCQTGKPAASISYFVTASKSTLYSTPTKPLTNAGICLRDAKDYKGAEDFLNRALIADPQNDDARFLLAEVYYQSGQLEKAQQRMAEVHKFTDPTPETAWLALRIERKLGNREAEGRFASVLKRNFPGSQQFQLMSQGKFE